MRSFSSPSAAMLGALLMPFALGCVHVTQKGGFDTVVAYSTTRGVRGRVVDGNGGARSGSRAHRPSSLAGELSLEQAVEVALLRNPALQARYEALGIGQADWAFHCHKSHHTMNAMGHGIPNVLGAN